MHGTQYHIEGRGIGKWGGNYINKYLCIRYFYMENFSKLFLLKLIYNDKLLFVIIFLKMLELCILHQIL